MLSPCIHSSVYEFESGYICSAPSVSFLPKQLRVRRFVIVSTVACPVKILHYWRYWVGYYSVGWSWSLDVNRRGGRAPSSNTLQWHPLVCPASRFLPLAGLSGRTG